MYVIVGHSAELRFVMSEELHDEIARGLWWFMLSLLAGVALLFIFLAWYFERKLQGRIAKPIAELSKQIKNPKIFMAARNKSVDFYSRKNTRRSFFNFESRNTSKRHTNNSVSGNNSSTDTDRMYDSEGNSMTARPLVTDSDPFTAPSRRGSSIGRTRVAKMMERSGTIAKMHEQDESIAKFKTIDEVEALRGVFYSFFETGS